jgi:diguanylate cyclase (GGDEF)-like protein
MGRIESGKRRDGSQVPVRLSVSDISDAMGTRYVGVIRDLSGGQAAESMRQQGMHDSLTGLPNHALAIERLHGACNKSREEGEGLALISIDIHQFKSINNTYGHAAGDTLLKSIAGRLRHGLSESDLVARTGGDEFLVLLRGIRRAAHAESALRRLEASLDQPFVAGAHKVAVDISAGLAVYGVDGTTPEALLLAVEQALRARKSAKAGQDAGRCTAPKRVR